MRLPHIVISGSGHISIPHEDVRWMDIIREVLELVDLNAPWLPLRVERTDWMALLATRVRIALHYPSVGRRLYMGGIRVYPGIDITVGMVSDIIGWMETEVGIVLYHRIGSTELEIQTEDVPTCPGCSSALELSWRRWRAQEYNILWLCPEYRRECREVMESTWPSMCPELIHDARGIPVFFHRWRGIPAEYVREPLTEWTLTGLESDPGVIEAIRRTNVRNTYTKATDLFSTEEVEWIQENYRTYESKGQGNATRQFTLKFIHARVSRYDIQRKAHSLGVAGRK